MKKLIIVTMIVFLTGASFAWTEDFPLKLRSIETELKNNYALNSFKDYYSSGIGLGVQAAFNIRDLKSIGFFTAADYFYGKSNTLWVDSFQDLNLTAGFSYTLNPGGQISVIPELGYGISNHLLLGDADRDGSESKDYFIDQILTLSVKGLYGIKKSYSIFIRPELILCIEKKNSPILLGFNLGSTINL